ncbi:MAG: YebC/PmpR family DNA-binding transcriptional regulator, partial [Spirochaetota bacterium]
NRNRTAADVRNIFSKGGGNLGENGSVSYMFKRKGIIAYPVDRYSEDQILEEALEAGAEDVTTAGTAIEVTTEPEDFERVLQAMEDSGFEHESASISKIPDATVSLDAEGTRKALKLIESLDDHDDVQEVSTNLDIPDDLDLSEE